MRTISGIFGGHFGPLRGIFVEHIQKRGISEKNEKFHFFPVRVWGWLRRVALVTKLFFSDFGPILIICLTLKIAFFGFVLIITRGANIGVQEVMKWPFLDSINFFTYKTMHWNPKLTKVLGKEHLKSQKNNFRNLV